jgi:hypothetical protein
MGAFTAIETSEKPYDIITLDLVNKLGICDLKYILVIV